MRELRWAVPETYIDREYIDVEDDDAIFKKAAHAANCFGGRYREALGKAFIWHPSEEGKTIWLPQFFYNSAWDNRLSPDGTTVTEISRDLKKAKEHIDIHLKGDKKQCANRIIIGHFRSDRIHLGPFPYGYRFVGEFKFDAKKTNYERGCVWTRESKRADTYQYT